MSISTDERRALAEAVREAAAGGPREFLADDGRPTRDERLWKVLSEQIGVAELLVPEVDGGAGAGLAEVAVVLEELAKALAVVPALSSAGMAVVALRAVDGDEAHRLLARLADGSMTATVAWPDAGSTDLTPTVVYDADRGTVEGCCKFVLDGSTVDLVLTPARVAGATALVAVDMSEERVTTAALRGLDLTRELATIEFDAAPAVVVADDVDLRAALDLCLVLLAAEQVGVAQRCHDDAVAWARERVQFDRPIGQFQAIKHQLVDLLMDVELARSALDTAVTAADAYLADPSAPAGAALRVAAGVAKARGGAAAAHVADQSLHIFGGIGFTWEHDAHLYYRRAKALELYLGAPAAHRARFARTLLEEARDD